MAIITTGTTDILYSRWITANLSRWHQTIPASLMIQVLIDRTRPFKVTFAVNTDAAEVAATFLRETGMADAPQALAWEAAIIDRVKTVVNAHNIAISAYAAGVNAPAADVLPVANSTVSSAVAAPDAEPQRTYQLQFPASGDPLEIAWNFLRETGREATTESEEWARDIARAVAAEQARLRDAKAARLAAEAEVTATVVGEPAPAVDGRADGVPEAATARPTIDVGGGQLVTELSAAGSDSDLPPPLNEDASSPDASTAEPPVTPQLDTRASDLPSVAPFAGVVPLTVEAPSPAPGDADAPPVLLPAPRDYDIAVAAGQPLAAAAHAFCVSEWSELEPALGALVVASGLNPTQLAFHGASPYEGVLEALEGDAGAYWRAPGRQVLLHYCSSEVADLMARWYASKAAWI